MVTDGVDVRPATFETHTLSSLELDGHMGKQERSMLTVTKKHGRTEDLKSIWC
jgi:hypothetical protein